MWSKLTIVMLCCIFASGNFCALGSILCAAESESGSSESGSSEGCDNPESSNDADCLEVAIFGRRDPLLQLMPSNAAYRYAHAAITHRPLSRKASPTLTRPLAVGGGLGAPLRC